MTLIFALDPCSKCGELSHVQNHYSIFLLYRETSFSEEAGCKTWENKCFLSQLICPFTVKSQKNYFGVTVAEISKHSQPHHKMIVKSH